MAERSKAAVSKTVNGFFPFGGSNPPLSAIFIYFTFAETVMDAVLLKDDINLILHGIRIYSKKDMKYLRREMT